VILHFSRFVLVELAAGGSGRIGSQGAGGNGAELLLDAGAFVGVRQEKGAESGPPTLAHSFR
jgi:hypothetical protein